MNWREFQNWLGKPEPRFIAKAGHDRYEQRARRAQRWQSVRGLLIVSALMLIAATAAVLFTMAVIR